MTEPLSSETLTDFLGTIRAGEVRTGRVINVEDREALIELDGFTGRDQPHVAPESDAADAGFGTMVARQPQLVQPPLPWPLTPCRNARRAPCCRRVGQAVG